MKKYLTKLRRNREWPYKNVKPRIIAEQYMEDKNTAELRDYKFFAIDGASVTGVFFKIVLPLSLPIVVAVAIFGAIENWNSFTDSLLLMSGEGNLRSLQHVLYAEAPKLDKAIGSNMYVNSYQFASAMISVVPILIAYPFIHRYLIKCAGPETLKK